MNKKTLLMSGVFLFCFLGASLLTNQEVVAQGSRPMSTPDRRVSRELWDIWRQGFEFYEKGEMKMIAGKYDEALPLYQRSLDAFQEVRKMNPRWNSSVIEYRMNLCRRRITTVKERAAEQQDELRRSVAKQQVALPKVSGSETAPKTSSVVRAANRDFDAKLKKVIDENELRKKQIAALQAELAKLRPDAARADNAINQIKGLMAERDQLDKQLTSLKLQFEKLQEEQRKISPRTAELERLLQAEQNKSEAYAKAFRERSAAHAQLESRLRILTAEKLKQETAYAELLKKYTTEQIASEKLSRQNAENLQKLKTALAAVEKKREALTVELAARTKDMNAVSAELRTLQIKGLSASDSAKKLAGQNAELLKNNALLKEELNKVNIVRNDLESRIRSLNQEVVKLKNDLVINIEQRNDFAKANDGISRQFKELELSLRKMKEDNSRLKLDLEKALKERDLLAEKVNNPMTDALRKQIASLQTQNQQLSQNLAQREKELEDLKIYGNPAHLKAQLAVAESRSKNLQDQLVTVQQGSATEVNRISAELKKKDEQFRQMQTQDRLLKNQLVALQEQIKVEQAKQLIAEQKIKSEAQNKAKISALQKEVAALQEQIKVEQAKQQIAEQKVKSEAQNKAKISALQKEVAALQEQLKAEQSKQLAAAPQAKSEVQSDARVTALQKEVSALQEQLKAEQSKQVAAASLAKSEAQNKAQISELQKELAALRTLLNDQKKSFDTKNSESAQLIVSGRAALEKKIRETILLRDRLQKITAERDQLAKVLENLKSKLPTVDQLNAKNQALVQSEMKLKKIGDEKVTLEKTIAVLQEKLGAADRKQDSLRRTIAVRDGDIRRLRTALAEFESMRASVVSARKAIAKADAEKEQIRKEAAAAENLLKQELQKNAALVLSLREENTKQREDIRKYTANEVVLNDQLKAAALRIGKLEKDLAKALSEEEKVEMRKQIADLLSTMKKMADGSEDDLVKEVAAKCVAIDGLINEHRSYKKEIRTLTNTAEAYRLESIRNRTEIEKAEDIAKLAVHDARKSRAELKMLQADIEDGIVKMPAKYKAVAVKSRKDTAEKSVGVIKVKPENKVKKAVKSQKDTKVVKAKKAPGKEYLTAMKQGQEAVKKGDLGMALWYYWQAADAGVDMPEPYFALTKLHIKRKEWSSAAGTYKKAIAYGGEEDKKLAEEIQKNLEQDQ